MNIQLFSSSPSLSLVCFLLVILVKIQSSNSSKPDFEPHCERQFECGNITAGYPFFGGDRWEGCGHPKFKLNCERPDDHDVPTMMINDVKYQVLDINPKAQTLRIAKILTYLHGFCPNFTNTTFDPELFSYSGSYENVTLHYCCLPSPINVHQDSKVNGVIYEDDFIQVNGEKCDGPGLWNANVTVPVPKPLLPARKANWSEWQQALQQGFELTWKIGGMACKECMDSKGSCVFDPSNGTICKCPHTDQVFFHRRCPSGKNGLSSAEVACIAVGGVAGIIVLVFLFVFIRKRRKIAAQSKTRDLQYPPTSNGTNTTTISLSQSIPSFPLSKRDIERGMKSTYFGAQVFDYTELEQATNNFHPSKELGDGGFGTVYYGLLRDGRVVAVKRLFQNNLKRVEQFINEIEILTKLRHPNLVTLYGCTSRHSRELLLVYEYIPNGTVADHIHERNSNSGLLPWFYRLSIAVETADALAFLHSSDVIHRDVKTNNILLDNNLRVKVADFGLSRLFPTDVTHVSTAPQGTPGYVDPEYYQCYHLTSKSDVYSFGVVLIELISSLEAVDTNRHRHDINLANMAISKIQNNALSELVDPALGFEKDYAVRSMVTSVAELAFRCLQQDRDARPSMQEVLDVLKGIQNEQFGALKAEVVDISTDDAALLKNAPPSISPDAAGNDKWVSCSPTPNSF